MTEGECWVCDSPEVVFEDVLKLGWCGPCYEDIYLGGDGEGDTEA